MTLEGLSTKQLYLKPIIASKAKDLKFLEIAGTKFKFKRFGGFNVAIWILFHKNV